MSSFKPLPSGVDYVDPITLIDTSFKPLPRIIPDDGDGDGNTCIECSYRHQQAVPLAGWIINHGLDFVPQITVIDSTGRVVEGDVEYTSPSQITVTFTSPFSGVAYLS